MFAHSQSDTPTPRVIHSSATRMLAAGMALAATWLFAPVQAQAQSIGGHEALRNVSTFGPYVRTTIDVAPGWTIDGAEALLGAKPAGNPREVRPSTESAGALRPVDGAHAFLARAEGPGVASR
jgi:hypothetical protein